MQRHLTVHTDATLTISSDRHRMHPWGVEGGLPAANSRVEMIHANGTTIELPGKITTEIHAGDQLITTTPGGGGWGDPAQRSRQAVADDVSERMVSPERARDVYGMGGAGEVSGVLSTSEI